MLFKNNKFLSALLLYCLAGIVSGSILLFSLISRFYFYEAVVVGILVVPIVIFFMIRSSRRSLLGLLVLAIPFNPCFHIVRNDSSLFNLDLNFWTSDLIVIFVFIYLSMSKGLGVRERQNSHALLWQLGLPLLLWIIAGALSIVPAVNKGIAIIELIRMVRIFIIFAAIFFLVEKPEDIHLIATCFVIAFAIQTVFVFAEYALGHPLFRLPGDSREADIVGAILRPGGTMGHSGNFAKLAALSLPICLAFIYTVRKNIWWITIGAVLISGLVALMLTVSRAGLGTSLFGLGWLFLIMLKNKRRNMLRTLAALSLFVIAVVLAWHIGGDRLKSRMSEDFGSALSRPQQFSVAWNVIKAHPFIGVGLNNYTLIAPHYDHTREAISITSPQPVHNIYLLYAAEIGIPAAVCFIWFLGATIALAFKVSPQVGSPSASALLKSIGVGITCSWLQGLIGWGFRSSIVHISYLAVLAGVLAASKYYNQNRSADHLNGT